MMGLDEENVMTLSVVITMAGSGSRFYQAGYKEPKYEIIANGKSLFDWSLLSLKNFISPGTRVIFVCLKDNQSSNYIHQRCSALGLSDVHVVELPRLTDGQATSAYMSRTYWLPNGPLLIYNIDTFVTPAVLQPREIRVGSDGWIPCFKVNGDHWSFVKIDKNEWAIDVEEKKRVSEFASVGLYWFACRKHFEYAYECSFADDEYLVKGERYIAPLYKKLISTGLRVSISKLASNAVHALGTPAELEKFMQIKTQELEGLSM